ncbi:hypothetical protein DAPPUDRAFT_237088 [Daphnia pulex]|uniref:Uncharacterized protein n=1 Tax=Daphnia pulex TaxID=6669 RepID=E9G453_DAPPU|nr:hypothetical protein DAPPUDRAFT_237088 [Daphnia pulex]|eukprot:EFX85693.1 hypothetical protein DAPPUDRAFT_237088 [Daphnia pulex]
MNFSVCFLEKSTQFFVESCGPGTDILEPTLAFVHDQRSAPSLSSRRNAEETSRRWTPKHLRYLQNVSADHHLLLKWLIISSLFK